MTTMTLAAATAAAEFQGGILQLLAQSGMVVKLDVTKLDGRPSTDFEARTTTLDVQVNNPNWFGKTRIVPGNPQASLLAELIGKRITGAADDNGQMPPIASKKIDTENVAHVIAWIESMERPE